MCSVLFVLGQCVDGHSSSLDSLHSARSMPNPCDPLCQTRPVSQLSPRAPRPRKLPSPAGTRVVLDADATIPRPRPPERWRAVASAAPARGRPGRWLSDGAGGGDVAGRRGAVRAHPRPTGPPASRSSRATTRPMTSTSSSRCATTSPSCVAARRSCGTFTSRSSTTRSRDAAALRECARRFGADLVRLEHEPRAGGGAKRRRRARRRDRCCGSSTPTSRSTTPRRWSRDCARRFERPAGRPPAPRASRVAPAPLRASRFEQRFSPLDMGASSALVVPRGIVAYVPSACLLVRRHAFGDGFDETLLVGEDVDLVWRLHDQGWLVRYDADVVVSHGLAEAGAAGGPARWLRRVVESPRAASRQAPGAVARRRAGRWWRGAPRSRASPMIGARIAKVAQRRLSARARGHRRRRRSGGQRTGRTGHDRRRRAARARRRQKLRCRRPRRVTAPEASPAGRRPVRASAPRGAFAPNALESRDLPLAVADDLAYGVGLVRGALPNPVPGGVDPPRHEVDAWPA